MGLRPDACPHTTSQSQNHVPKEPHQLDALIDDESRAADVNELTVYHINDTDLDRCPHGEVLFGNKLITLAIDSGTQASILNEQVYHKLISSGVEFLNSRLLR
jgi:hypothetical protein